MGASEVDRGETYGEGSPFMSPVWSNTARACRAGAGDLRDLRTSDWGGGVERVKGKRRGGEERKGVCG